MRKLILWAVLFAVPAFAQTPVDIQRATLYTAFDLDGEAADADQIVTVIALTDSATYTVAASPDVCRKVDITVVDADSSITAGVLTVTGTDCFDIPKVATYTFAAGGSAVYDLTVTGFPGRSAYFKTVTAVGTGVLTGEGGADTVTVGYTSNSENGWAMWGRRNPDLPGGIHSVNPFGWYEVPRAITTSAANSATVTGVDSDADAFESVSAGDLIQVAINGTVFERKVTARASADSITVSAPLNIPATGVTFRYKRFFSSTDPWDIVAVPVDGFRTLMFDWSIDANANTGGVVTLMECTAERVEFPTARWVTPTRTATWPVTTASAGTQVNSSESMSLELLPYTYCRMGMKFGTGDDVDAAPEDINLAVTLMR